MEEHEHFMNTIISFQNMGEPEYTPQAFTRKLPEDQESRAKIAYL